VVDVGSAEMLKQKNEESGLMKSHEWGIMDSDRVIEDDHDKRRSHLDDMRGLEMHQNLGM
jgi:hypothetical protein